MAGLPVGGFIAIVIVILAMNVGGVFGYYKYLEKNPEKATPVKLGSERFAMLRWVMIGLIALSWIFSIACTTACSFVNFEYRYDASSLFGNLAPTIKGSFGFNCAAGSESRVNTAYAFAVINNLLTTTVLVGTLLVQFNALKVVQLDVLKKDAAFVDKVWKIMGFLILASTWCCLFTFYIQQASVCVEDVLGTSCSLGGAGVAQVFNSMLLIGICCLFLIVPSPSASENDGEMSASDEGKNNKEDPAAAPEESTAKNDKENDDEEEATSVKDSAEEEE